MGCRQLEAVLCQTDVHGRSIHDGLLLNRSGQWTCSHEFRYINAPGEARPRGTGIRIVGAVTGLAIFAFAFATSRWDSTWVLALIAVVVIGGGVAYHLLTSMVRCPSCGNGVFNFRIGQVGEKKKTFSCRQCGATAWLAEGFYWQRDING